MLNCLQQFAAYRDDVTVDRSSFSCAASGLITSRRLSLKQSLKTVLTDNTMSASGSY